MARLMTQAQVMAAITECEAQLVAVSYEMGTARDSMEAQRQRLRDLADQMVELTKARDALDAMRLVLITKGTG